MTNKEHIDLFLQEKELSSSPKTLQFYRENLNRFYDWCCENAICYAEDSPDPEEYPFMVFTKQIYMDYLKYLKSTGIKNTSLHTYHRAIRTFCNWMVEEEYIVKPFTNVKLPRGDADPIIPLTASEVKRIDAAIEKNWYKNRNYCMIHLMLDCGLRRQEVINLDWKDFHYDDKSYVVIRNSKYSKNRMVPVPRFLAERIRELCSRRDEFIFVGDDGRRVTVDALKNLFRKLKIETEIERIHAHLLRHTFATSFIAGGGNLEFLRMYLGHADYLITQKYLHVSMEMQISGYDIYKLDRCFFRNYNNMGGVE